MKTPHKWQWQGDRGNGLCKRVDWCVTCGAVRWIDKDYTEESVYFRVGSSKPLKREPKCKKPK